MRSQPAGILAIVGSTVLSALFFGIILGGPAIAWAAPTVAATSFVAQNADAFNDNYCCIQVGVPTTVSFTAQIGDFNNPALKGSLLVKLMRVSDTGSETTVCQMKDSTAVGTGQGSSFHNVGKGLFICDQTFNEPLAISMRLKVRLNYSLKNSPSSFESGEFILLVGEFFDAGAAGTVQGNGVTVHVPPGSLRGAAFVSAKKGKVFGANPGNKPVVEVVNLTVDSAVFGGEAEDPSLPFDIEVQTQSGLIDGTKLVVAQEVFVDKVTLPSGGQCPMGYTLVDGPTPICVGSATAQAIPVACASVSAGTIMTTTVLDGQPCALPGILTAGTYGILAGNGSGYASGTVTQGGVAQPGVVVSNPTNTLVATTDSSGKYTLFVDTPGGGQFTVNAFHPLKGSVGSGTGTIPSELGTGTANITLTAPSAPVNTRPGIRNGGFERGDLSSWAFTGGASVIQQLGPTATYVPPNPLCKTIKRGNNINYQNICSPSAWGRGTLGTIPGTILPSEGKSMAALRTNDPTTGLNTGSSLKQTITVPAGATKFRMNYNYVTEEITEWVGKPFQDPFTILINCTANCPSGWTPKQFQSTVNSAFTLISSAGAVLSPYQFGDCFAASPTPGDTSCAQTNWRTVEFDLSSAAGTNATLELLFTLSNGGDGQYETRVLIDDIRFQTIWVDAKILKSTTRFANRVNYPTAGQTGAVDNALVERDVRNVTEILSQAGVNVRLRRITTVPVVDTLLDVDVNHQLNATEPNCLTTASPPAIVLGVDGVALTNKVLTTEEQNLMNMEPPSPAPPTVATDVNLYYVISATGVSGVKAFTANPGDFCSEVVAPATNTGTMLTSIATDFTLAHELGHETVEAVSGSTRLHAAPTGSFTVGSPSTGVVQINQSQALYCGDLTESTSPKCSQATQQQRLDHGASPLLQP